MDLPPHEKGGIRGALMFGDIILALESLCYFQFYHNCYYCRESLGQRRDYLCDRCDRKKYISFSIG